MENRSDAYQTLNLPENASREQIDEAYTAMLERFSEVNYLGSPLWDMAAEKRAKIRAAYALLTAEAPEPAWGVPAPEEPVPKAPDGETPAVRGSLPRQSVSVRVRKLLNANDPDGAEAFLKAQPEGDSDPETIYLRGMIAWKRGWLDEATEHLEQAAGLEPQNAEYKSAVEQIKQGLPRFRDWDKAKKTNGKRVCGACGAGAGECLCEALCESIC